MTGVLQRHYDVPPGSGSRLKRLLGRIDFRLVRRLLIYHSALAAALLAAAMLLPDFTDYLPVGDIEDLIAGDALTVVNVEATPVRADPELLASVVEAGSKFDRLGYARKLVIVLTGT